MLILQNVHKNRELETQPVTAEENVRHGYKTDTRGATFWWLGDSSRWCFIFSSFAAISLILMLTCSNQTLQISSTNDTETTSSTLIFFVCYFVDPKDHGIFQVKRQLLGGTEVGETLDAGHHLFYADHLHYVGHHQGIDEVDVRALQAREDFVLEKREK